MVTLPSGPVMPRPTSTPFELVTKINAPSTGCGAHPGDGGSVSTGQMGPARATISRIVAADGVGVAIGGGVTPRAVGRMPAKSLSQSLMPQPLLRSIMVFTVVPS